MSASKINQTASADRIGILSGGGLLPHKLVQACDEKGIEVFVVGFEGQTDPTLIQGRNHLWTRLGATGQIIKTLKSHGIRDIVMIGAIRRPTIAELRPDFKTAEFFAGLGWASLGDDGLLGALKKFFQKEGFRIRGVQEFAQDLLAPEGPIGAFKPENDDWRNIDRGIEVSQQLGLIDVGQAVIVQEGIVLGVEAVEGTDNLIRRCKDLMRKGRGGVLIKTCKPQQDKSLDLPAIGKKTVELAAECGLSGIVIHAGQSLLVDAQEVAEVADKHKIFVIGVTLSGENAS